MKRKVWKKIGPMKSRANLTSVQSKIVVLSKIYVLSIKKTINSMTVTRYSKRLAINNVDIRVLRSI